MSAPQLLAVQAVVAETATRDREAAADMVLAVAVTAAIELFREGRPGQAEFRLARAQASAARILGGAS